MEKKNPSLSILHYEQALRIEKKKTRELAQWAEGPVAGLMTSDPWDTHGERREPTPTRYPLTSTSRL